MFFLTATQAATTTAATQTSIIMPSRASIRVCPMMQASPPHCTIPRTTVPLHRSAFHQDSLIYLKSTLLLQRDSSR